MSCLIKVGPFNKAFSKKKKIQKERLIFIEPLIHVLLMTKKVKIERKHMRMNTFFFSFFGRSWGGGGFLFVVAHFDKQL